MKNIMRLEKLYVLLVVLLSVSNSLGAVYWSGRTDETQITDCYQEIIVVECGNSLAL